MTVIEGELNEETTSQSWTTTVFVDYLSAGATGRFDGLLAPYALWDQGFASYGTPLQIVSSGVSYLLTIRATGTTVSINNDGGVPRCAQ